jgi:hypothetical protein
MLLCNASDCIGCSLFFVAGVGEVWLGSCFHTYMHHPSPLVVFGFWSSSSTILLPRVFLICQSCFIYSLPISRTFLEPGHQMFGQPQKCRKCNGSYLVRHRWRPNVSPCFVGQFHTRFLIRFRVFSLGLLLVQARAGLGLVECCLLPFFVSWPWECKNYAYSGWLPGFSVTLPTTW